MRLTVADTWSVSLRSRARRVRWMMERSSVSRCGRSAERRSWSTRREKRSLADSTEAGFRPRRSVQRNAKALTSFSRSAFPASSSSFWKSILGTKNKLGNGFTEATSYHCLPHFLLFIFHVSATLPQMFRLHLSVQTEEGNCPQKKKSHER